MIGLASLIIHLARHPHRGRTIWLGLLLGVIFYAAIYRLLIGF